MKTFMLSIAVLAYSIVSCQDIPASKVPSVVLNTFNAKFTNTTGLEWEKKGNMYEAEFDVNNVDHKALLDASGKLVMFKRDILSSDLPAAVMNTINTQYKDFKIDDAEKIEKNGTTLYQVELDGRPRDKKLVINADGRIETKQRYW